MRYFISGSNIWFLLGTKTCFSSLKGLLFGSFSALRLWIFIESCPGIFAPTTNFFEQSVKILEKKVELNQKLSVIHLFSGFQDDCSNSNIDFDRKEPFPLSIFKQSQHVLSLDCYRLVHISFLFQ